MDLNTLFGPDVSTTFANAGLGGVALLLLQRFASHLLPALLKPNPAPAPPPDKKVDPGVSQGLLAALWAALQPYWQQILPLVLPVLLKALSDALQRYIPPPKPADAPVKS